MEGVDASEVNVLNYGAVGDGVTDDTYPIQQALDAASALYDGTTRTRCVVPSTASDFRCEEGLTVPSNVHLVVDGTLKSYGGDTLGQFLHVRAVSNVEISGSGTIDANGQSGANGIAVSNGDQGAEVTVEDVTIRDVTVRNARHGGRHIADDTDPGFVGHGGGKGITVQFGCTNVAVHDVAVEDCDIGIAIEGKEDGPVSGVSFATVDVVRARYIGALLWGTTAAPVGSYFDATLSGVSFEDCAHGDTSESTPQPISDLFGVLSLQAATGLTVDATITNASGKVTLVRGSHRDSDLTLSASVADLYNGMWVSPYGGYNPATPVSRNNVAVIDVTADLLEGHLVEFDPSYPDEDSTYGFTIPSSLGAVPDKVRTGSGSSSTDVEVTET